MVTSCLQTLQNLKKKKGKKKRKKDNYSSIKTYFQNEDVLLQNSGNEVFFLAIVVYFFLCKFLLTFLHTVDNVSGRPEFSGELLHAISCILTQLLALKKKKIPVYSVAVTYLPNNGHNNV